MRLRQYLSISLTSNVPTDAPAPDTSLVSAVIYPLSVIHATNIAGIIVVINRLYVCLKINNFPIPIVFRKPLIALLLT